MDGKKLSLENLEGLPINEALDAFFDCLDGIQALHDRGLIMGDAYLRNLVRIANGDKWGIVIDQQFVLTAQKPFPLPGMQYDTNWEQRQFINQTGIKGDVFLPDITGDIRHLGLALLELLINNYEDLNYAQDTTSLTVNVGIYGTVRTILSNAGYTGDLLKNLNMLLSDMLQHENEKRPPISEFKKRLGELKCEIIAFIQNKTVKKESVTPSGY